MTPFGPGGPGGPGLPGGPPGPAGPAGPAGPSVPAGPAHATAASRATITKPRHVLGALAEAFDVGRMGNLRNHKCSEQGTCLDLSAVNSLECVACGPPTADLADARQGHRARRARCTSAQGIRPLASAQSVANPTRSQSDSNSRRKL